MSATLFPALLSAQSLEPPLAGYWLVAPSAACPDAQQYYTCSYTGNVAYYQLPSTIDWHGCTNGVDCHVEFCTVSNPPVNSLEGGKIPPGACLWVHGVFNGEAYLATFNFDPTSNGDAGYTMYGEYRVVYRGTAYVSSATTWPPNAPNMLFVLNSLNHPTVALTSPAGIPNNNSSVLTSDNCQSGPGSGYPLCQGGYQFQQLNINSSYQQAATYTASAAPPESVNVSVIGCSSTCDIYNPLVSYYPAPPFFVWWAGATAGEYTSLSLTATDQGGLQASIQGPTALSLYDPDPPSGPAAPATASCGLPGGGDPYLLPCLAVADASSTFGTDIAGDSQSQSCPYTNATGEVFCGYADASIRADTNRGDGPEGSPWWNFWGNMLWMSYSVPILYSNSSATTNYGKVMAVRIDSGYSTDGGVSWQSWCSGSDCDAYTSLYPSMMVSGSGSTAVYSSHEVSNIWICPASICGGTQPTSFAAHLMYFTSAANPIIGPTNLSAGCIVISTASGPPSNLAWSTATPPTTCMDTTDLPSGSNYALFSDLNALTNNTGGLTGSCVSWGEPAIMVTDAFSPGTATMYLAVACFNQSVQGTYYVFSTNNLSLTWTNGCTSGSCFQKQWTLLGSFSANDLPSLAGLPGYSSYPTYMPNSITELDWSLRPSPSGGSTVVAVLTPQEIPNSPQQFGCVAVNFTMPNGTTITNPLQGSSILANVTDSYAEDSNNWMGQRPGACTYEPASTIGIAFTRGLVKQATSSGGGPASPLQKEYIIEVSGATP